MQGVGGGKGPRHPLEHIQTGGVRRRRRKGSQAVQSLAPAQLCNPVVAILRVKLTGDAPSSIILDPKPYFKGQKQHF